MACSAPSFALGVLPHSLWLLSRSGSAQHEHRTCCTFLLALISSTNWRNLHQEQAQKLQDPLQTVPSSTPEPTHPSRLLSAWCRPGQEAPSRADLRCKAGIHCSFWPRGSTGGKMCSVRTGLHTVPAWGAPWGGWFPCAEVTHGLADPRAFRGDQSLHSQQADTHAQVSIRPTLRGSARQ